MHIFSFVFKEVPSLWHARLNNNEKLNLFHKNNFASDLRLNTQMEYKALTIYNVRVIVHMFEWYNIQHIGEIVDLNEADMKLLKFLKIN